MGWMQAAGWGAAGGLAAVLLSMMATVTARGFRWPWHQDPEALWPILFVYGGSVVLGALVAAAAHSQMTGPWPAFIMGVGAPAIVRAALSRVEVEARKPEALVEGDGSSEG